MAKKTNEFTLVTTLADSDTLTGVQNGNLDIGISAASLKGKMGTIADAGGYFATDTVEAALQQLGAAIAALPATYQPVDSDLTALASLTTTAFGRSLLTATDASVLVTTLNAQPSDADLTAIAALTTTAFGRSLLTQANAAAVVSLISAQPAAPSLTTLAQVPVTFYAKDILAKIDAATVRAYIGAAPTGSPIFTGNVVVPDANAPTEAVSKQQMDAADALKVDKATLTTDDDMYIRSGGVVSRITLGALAAKPAFTGIIGPTGPQGPQGLVGPQGPAGPARTVKADTTAAYVPVFSDENQMITLSNAGPIIVTLPSDGTTTFNVGAEIDFLWFGVGQPTFVAGSGAAVEATPTLKMRARYSAATAKKVAANTWVVIGDMAPF
jgi:hypothetical protein